MTTPKQLLNSHSPSVEPLSGREPGPYSAHYAVDRDYSGWILLLIILVALRGAALAFGQNAAAQTQPAARSKTQYNVSTLPSLGGTVLITKAGRQAIPECRTGTGTLFCGETVR